MVTKMKKKALVLLTIATMVIGSSAISFAGTSTTSTVSKKAEVTGFMYIEPTGVDVEITSESGTDLTAQAGGIMITRKEGSPTELEIPAMKIINKGTAGSIKLTDVEVDGINGWSLKPNDQQGYFESLSANTKELSMVFENHDYGKSGSKYTLTGNETDYSTKYVVAPSKDITVKFTGKAGIVTKNIDNVEVANVVVTIAIA
jgi:hypothetical protein